MNFTARTKDEKATITFSEPRITDDVTYVDVLYKTDEKKTPEQFEVVFGITTSEAYSTWGESETKGGLAPAWHKKETFSRLAAGLPLHGIVSLTGKNKLMIALSDAKTPTALTSGVREEPSGDNLECVVKFFTQKTTAINEYKATIRIDTREIPYYDAIYSAVEWWEGDCGYTPVYVPDHAKLPMNSTWYSYHQRIDVDSMVEQCRLSKELGMESIIVDDGWQTDNTLGGYSYCGDWEPTPEKVKDMKEFVDRVHETGMKFLLWFSVPWVGRYSKAYERFKTMLLDQSGWGEWWAFDPRYKEVREYLVGIYTNAVKEWGLDGLKLDFIDSFKLAGKSLDPDPRRDTEDLEEGVDRLMKSVKKAITEINPEIMVEFRQPYVGPTIRMYGNMLRVTDCPADAIRNRAAIAGMRLTSGKTAVHSDMLMWHYDEPVESAATQLVGALYGVPQISMLIEKLNDEHYKMLRYYLSFWREHRDILLDGKLTAKNPECSYSSVASTLKNKSVVTLYTDRVVDTVCDYLVCVNATPEKSIFVKGYKGRSFETVDCMGNKKESGIIASDVFEIAVPMCGMVFIK